MYVKAVVEDRWCRRKLVSGLKFRRKVSQQETLNGLMNVPRRRRRQYPNIEQPVLIESKPYPARCRRCGRLRRNSL